MFPTKKDTATYPRNWSDIRARILERDAHRCFYCKATNNLVVHHIRPINMAGNHADYNLLTLCRPCHMREHMFIRTYGLATIPGPTHEAFRAYLTNPSDVERYLLSVYGITSDHAEE